MLGCGRDRNIRGSLENMNADTLICNGRVPDKAGASGSGTLPCSARPYGVPKSSLRLSLAARRKGSGPDVCVMRIRSCSSGKEMGMFRSPQCHGDGLSVRCDVRCRLHTSAVVSAKWLRWASVHVSVVAQGFRKVPSSSTREPRLGRERTSETDETETVDC